MSKKSGKEAYDEIRKVRADVKVLFMSGYSLDQLLGRGIFDRSEEVLIRPIHPLELVRKVRAVLDSKSQIYNGDSR
jgi:polar amino acid transport system substrate-binding protein